MDVASEHRTIEVRPVHLERAINFFREHPELSPQRRACACLMNQALRDAFPLLRGEVARPSDMADSRYSCGAGWWVGPDTGPNGQPTNVVYQFDQRGTSLVRAFDGAFQALLDHGPEAFSLPLPMSVELTASTMQELYEDLGDSDDE